MLNLNLHLIGDPHLGRKFEVGVPLHRRGEREAEQLVKLQSELAVPCRYNVCVGDLFDGPYVGHAVVTQVAEAYRTAAFAHPSTTFVVIAGNHDLPKAVNVRGAWLSFKLMTEDVRNIVVVEDVVRFDGITCIGWDWSRSALEQLEHGPRLQPIVIGHWDLQSFGGDDSHLCPTARLVELGAERIISGHYHLAGTYTVDGIDVECTGSMLPYSHAEDPGGRTYVTMSLLELQMIRPEVIKDKFVRVILEPGEVLPDDIDCRALTAKRMKSEAVDAPDTSSDFDWNATLSTALKPLQPYVRDFITDRLTT